MSQLRITEVLTQLQKLEKKICCVEKEILTVCEEVSELPVSVDALDGFDLVFVKNEDGCMLKAYTPIAVYTITFHDNFADLNADLPQPQPADTMAAVRNSQGTKWLPGPLGGTFYPKGYYRSTGAVWEFFGDFSYQANQADADAGLIDDQFITPWTLANLAKWLTKNNSIQFEDEGGNLGTSGTVDEVDFVGAGVTAARAGNKVTVTIPGGGGGGGGGYGVNSLTFASSPYSEIIVAGEVIDLIDCTGGVFVFNLPTAVGNNGKITITKTDASANTVDINPFGAETISGDSLIQILFQDTSITLMSDTLNWFIT